MNVPMCPQASCVQHSAAAWPSAVARTDSFIITRRYAYLTHIIPGRFGMSFAKKPSLTAASLQYFLIIDHM